MVLTASGVVCGRGLKQDNVPGNTQWLLHVDFDAFRSSEIGKLVMQETQSKYQDKINALTQLLGSDITKDLYGMTIYGKDADEENVGVLVYGKYNQSTLQSLVVLNQAYSKTEYNGKTIHHWTDENRELQQYGTFASEDTIVIAQSEDCVKTALDVLSGRQMSLAQQTDSALSKLCSERKNTIAMVAVVGMADLASVNEQAAILKNSKLLAALVAEAAANMKLNIYLEAQDEQTAMQIEQMARGILAFAALQGSRHPQVSKMIAATNLSRSGAVLDCSLSYPSADLFEFLKSQQPEIELKLPEDKDSTSDTMPES